MSSQRDLTGLAVEDKTGNPDPQEDELYETAVEMVKRLEKASISLLQRRLRIGYTRAARLIDMMEERGVVGPPKEGSSKPRDVLAGLICPLHPIKLEVLRRKVDQQYLESSRRATALARQPTRQADPSQS